MALTNQQLLDAVELQINAILTAGVAEYAVGGGGSSRQVTKLGLEALFVRRDKLMAAIAREKTGSFSVAEFRSMS